MDASFPSVTIAEVPEMFGEGIVLLDVREDDEWDKGHAPGALHIPLVDVPARLDDIDIDADIFVICRNGGRSRVASEYLVSLGYEVTNVNGGMVAWASAGRVLIDNDGAQGDI